MPIGFNIKIRKGFNQHIIRRFFGWVGFPRCIKKSDLFLLIVNQVSIARLDARKKGVSRKWKWPRLNLDQVPNRGK
jgi:hypothetical protein